MHTHPDSLSQSLHLFTQDMDVLQKSISCFPYLLLQCTPCPPGARGGLALHRWGGVYGHLSLSLSGCWVLGACCPPVSSGLPQAHRAQRGALEALPHPQPSPWTPLGCPWRHDSPPPSEWRCPIPTGVCGGRWMAPSPQSERRMPCTPWRWPHWGVSAGSESSPGLTRDSLSSPTGAEAPLVCECHPCVHSPTRHDEAGVHSSQPGSPAEPEDSGLGSEEGCRGSGGDRACTTTLTLFNPLGTPRPRVPLWGGGRSLLGREAHPPRALGGRRGEQSECQWY